MVPKMESWYFAYGSNLCCEQLNARLGSGAYLEQAPRIVRLPEHRLILRQTASGGPAFMSISTPGEGVIGVTYRFREADFELLDPFEEGYERRPITVTDVDGGRHSAVAYFMTGEPPATVGLPEAGYLERIVRGAKRHGLPETYIAGILAMAAGRRD
jgi:gamma-glutamylcyclotransferase (GGCT)/AIG2-like uncharacterized protein YtfP